MVLPYTKLEEMCKKAPSIYKPYSDEELIYILAEIKKEVPEYCRIIRLLRDFPSELVLRGSKLLNIRQIMQKRRVQCRCVRCREIKNGDFKFENIELVEREYEANGGKEIFLSFEDTSQDKLLGLLRLRLPSKAGQKELAEAFPELDGAALVRELHVYGQQQHPPKKFSSDKEGELSLGVAVDSKTQHIGFGRKLMQKAEQTAREKGFSKIAVIAAIGTREYYKKLKYRLEGTYMVKDLS